MTGIITKGRELLSWKPNYVNTNSPEKGDQMIQKLEHKAIQLLLAGDNPVLEALRSQYVKSQILSVQPTGVGFYINYLVPEEAVNLPATSSFCFGDIEGKVNLEEHEIGFLLWVKNGALAFLEIYTYEVQWPNQITAFTLSYFEGGRNLPELRRAWS